MFQTNGLFPLRLLGFGFYWAWLFLVAVSPSPVFGLLLGPLDAPFELFELLFRAFFLLLVIIFSKKLASLSGKNVLLFISVVIGPLSTIALFYFGSPSTMIIPTLFIALADVAMFLLWLSFFGHMKLGETALLLALSYAVGSIICLIIMNIDNQTALACSAVLPVLSGLTFYMSNHFYSKNADNEELFATQEQGEAALEPTFPYVKRMMIALALYALIFGLYMSSSIENGFDLSLAGPYIEAPCCLVLGVIIAIVIKSPKRGTVLYALYRVIPLFLCAGLVSLFLLEQEMFIVSGSLILVGYLTFEIFALNDVCNAVKARGMSLLRTMGIARFAISIGMLAGWFIGCFGSLFNLSSWPSLLITASIGILVVTVVSTLIFTEKELFSIRGIASERALLEKSGASSEEEFRHYLETFSVDSNLSIREIEVLELLLKGRNTQYISETLFIANGTAKTHVYNIYRKIGVHTKMELLDEFDRFRSDKK